MKLATRPTSTPSASTTAPRLDAQIRATPAQHARRRCGAEAKNKRHKRLRWLWLLGAVAHDLLSRQGELLKFYFPPESFTGTS